MGMQAVGAYLRVLREAQHTKRVALAEELGVDDAQIERIEKGLVAPQSPFLLLLIYAVQGDLEQVAELMRDSAATAATGRQYAGALLAQRPFQEEQQARWQEAQHLLEQLRTNPQELERWVAYAKRMRDRKA